jgi:hypothetical protein
MNRKLFQALASKVQALRFCQRTGDAWADKHREMIEKLVMDYMPRGSGFDSGTTIDVDASTGEKLVFETAFHHLDGNGCYDGWTDHTVTVKPSLIYGFTLLISGRDRNEVKAYISEAFDASLSTEISSEQERAIAVRLGHIVPAEREMIAA